MLFNIQVTSSMLNGDALMIGDGETLYVQHDERPSAGDVLNV